MKWTQRQKVLLPLASALTMSGCVLLFDFEGFETTRSVPDAQNDTPSATLPPDAAVAKAFRIATVEPTRILIERAETVTVKVTVERLEPLEAPIAVRLVGLAVGVTATPPEVLLTDTQTEASFTLGAATSATSGTFAAAVEAEAGGRRDRRDLEIEVLVPGLDREFGTDGIALGPSGTLVDMIVDGAGRVLVLSSSADTKTLSLHALDESNANAPTFVTLGATTVDGTISGTPRLFAFADGSVLAVGSTTRSPTESGWAALVLGTDGGTQSTGGDLTRSETMTDGVRQTASRVVMMTNAFQAPDGGLFRTASLRAFRADGGIDETFADGGRGIDTGLMFTRIAALPDGRMVVGGGVGNDYFLRGYAAQGARDVTFADGGDRPTPVPDAFGIRAIAATPSAHTAVIRRLFGGGGNEGRGVAFVRVLADGGSDDSFGDGGTLLPPEDPGVVPRDVILATDGRLLVLADDTGTSLVQTRCVVMSRRSDGSADTRFAPSGVIITEILPMCVAGRLASRGRKVFAGNTRRGTVPNVVVMRYTH